MSQRAGFLAQNGLVRTLARGITNARWLATTAWAGGWLAGPIILIVDVFSMYDFT